eukprot:9330045-Alexandrium_andersonii.AAC.1
MCIRDSQGGPRRRPGRLLLPALPPGRLRAAPRPLLQGRHWRRQRTGHQCSRHSVIVHTYLSLIHISEPTRLALI